MSFTSGFFNSHNGDRAYDAEQMSTLFGGIITDGVFKNYPETGQHFNISVSGRNVTLGPGRAWLNDIWINNNANYTVRLDPLSQVQVNAGYERVDALYFKVDKSNAGRAGSVYVAKGTAAAPETAAFVRMEDTAEVFYHIIAIFRIVPTGNTIGSWQSRIGTNHDPVEYNTPYIVGPLEAETLLAEFNETVDEKVQAIMDTYMADEGSLLYKKVSSVPMVWLCSSDVPTIAGRPGTLTNADSALYPNFIGPMFGLHNTTRRQPKAGDVVLGANGYYATVYSVSVTLHPSGRYYDGFEVVVTGTGYHMNAFVSSEPVYLVSFWGGTQAVNPSCDRTYSEIKAAYDNGKVLRFRWTPEDAEASGFDWDTANVYSGTQFTFSGNISTPHNTAFVFRYEDFMPSTDDYESSAWEMVSLRIDANDSLSIEYSAM